jgi:fatty-acid desaturase
MMLSLHMGAVLSTFYVSNWGIFVVSFLIWHQISHMFGMAIVYHKLFCHRSFVPKKGVAELGTLINILSFKGKPDMYALVHRIHHQHADTELDPHTPRYHWYRGYFGVIFPTDVLNKFSNQTKRNIVNDIYNDFKWIKLLTIKFQLVALIVFYTVIYTISHDVFAGILVNNVVSLHLGLFVNLFGHQKMILTQKAPVMLLATNRPWLANFLVQSFLTGASATGFLTNANHKYHHDHPDDFNEADPKNFELAAWLVKNFLSKRNLT